MSKKQFSIKIIIVLVLIVFAGTIFQAIYYGPEDDISLPDALVVSTLGIIPPKIDKENTILPTRLIIPKIEVDAEVTQVGINKKGRMATPRNFSEVGWYKYGTVPGEQGSAVIAGHVDNGFALPAVFSNLKNLKKGDDIYIEEKEDERLHFIVTEIDTYDFDYSDTGEIFSDQRGKLLKLITCTGTWIPAYKTHDQRLVVTALLAD